MSFLGGEADPSFAAIGCPLMTRELISKKTGTVILIRPSLLRVIVSLLLELGRNPSKPLRCKRLLLGCDGICPCNLAKSPCNSPNCRGDGLASDCQHSHLKSLILKKFLVMASEANSPPFPASFRTLGFHLQRQRRFFGEFSRAPTRKSLAGHLGVNIFGESTARGARGPALSVLKAEQLPLLGPVGGEFEGQPHQPLCAELRRVFAVDDGRDDIGCQRRKPQQA